MAASLSENHGHTVIFVGSFNPRIFQPAWLAAQDLIREAESEAAEIEIIHEEVVDYSLDWARVEVKRDQMTVETTSKTESPELVRDLARGMIEILSHTPIHGMLLMYWAHYEMQDQEERDKFGWNLVPQKPWERFLRDPRLTGLTVTGGPPEADEEEKAEEKHRLSITLEPSYVIQPNGIYLSLADQYLLAKKGEAGLGANLAIDALKGAWDPFLTKTREIPDQVLEAAS